MKLLISTSMKFSMKLRTSVNEIMNECHLTLFHSSGQAAVITPRQVTSGLGSRRVKAIAAAKHHMVIASEGGEVFTWGSNRG